MNGQQQGGGIIIVKGEKFDGTETSHWTGTKAEGQTICDSLTAAGHTALAADIQPVVNSIPS
jgi:hypothetical protein